jgi:hypothetical protein
MASPLLAGAMLTWLTFWHQMTALLSLPPPAVVYPADPSTTAGASRLNRRQATRQQDQRPRTRTRRVQIQTVRAASHQTMNARGARHPCVMVVIDWTRLFFAKVVLKRVRICLNTTETWVKFAECVKINSAQRENASARAGQKSLNANVGAGLFGRTPCFGPPTFFEYKKKIRFCRPKQCV